jgi:hypothetical protein
MSDETLRSQTTTISEGTVSLPMARQITGAEASLLPGLQHSEAAAETDPLHLLLDELRQRVEAIERRIEGQAPHVESDIATAAEYLHERLTELYGHLGLHMPPRS